MIRITGGEFRGRSISAPSNDRTRPTQAKLRQALFNSIQVAVPDAQVLDLFAGSGSLGFEALSRGAKRAVFVESVRLVAGYIEKNGNLLKVRDRMKLIVDPVEKALAKIHFEGPFDIVFADPPYASGWETRLLTDIQWEHLLKPNGYLLIEWGNQKSKAKALPEAVPFLVKVREKNYGDSVLTTYRRVSVDETVEEPSQETDPE